MEEEHKLPKLSTTVFGLLAFVLLCLVISFFTGNEKTAELFHKTGRMAGKVFRILGLDGRSNKPETKTFEKAEKEELKNTTATLPVLRIGNEYVYYPEFAFYALASKYRYEAGRGDAIWQWRYGGIKAGDLMTEEILRELIQVKIVSREAEKAGVRLNEREQREIRTSAEEQIGGIDPVLLAKYYLDTDLITDIYGENFLAEKYFNAVAERAKEEGDREDTETVFKELYDVWRSEREIRYYRENIDEMNIFGQGI